jgi:hypothetical protein
MSFGLRDLIVKMSPKGGGCPEPTHCRGESGCLKPSAADEDPCTPTNINPCGPTDKHPCGPTKKHPGKRTAPDPASGLEALRLQLLAALSG